MTNDWRTNPLTAEDVRKATRRRGGAPSSGPQTPVVTAVKKGAAIVVGLWLLVAAALSANLPGLFTRLQGGGFEDPRATAWQVQAELEQRFDASPSQLTQLGETLATLRAAR